MQLEDLHEKIKEKRDGNPLEFLYLRTADEHPCLNGAPGRNLLEIIARRIFCDTRDLYPGCGAQV